MSRKVLHLLSQRPSLTGSGVSLEAAVRHAARAGWDQRVVVGTPHDDPQPQVGGLDDNHIHPLVFGAGDLDFLLPGMSDVMPYPSSRFSALSAQQLDSYRAAWRRHVTGVVEQFQPHVIHSHHIWLLSALVKDVAPDIPVVNQCHATGLRQMELCPHLAQEVRRGCRRNDRFFVLHGGHAEALADRLDVEPDRIHVVGAGYQPEIFHDRSRSSKHPAHLAYAGKYSHAKGLPQLLDAVTKLVPSRRDLVLHVAGDGAGEQAEALRDRMAAMAPHVVMHGQLDQQALAELMRQCAVFVLPSFYEGLPLVLVEAVACGCRLVCTDLPGVRSGLLPAFGAVLDLVPAPRLRGPDVPVGDDLPAFVDSLAERIDAALDMPLGDPARTMPELLEPFIWSAVFARIERVWRELAGEAH